MSCLAKSASLKGKAKCPLAKGFCWQVKHHRTIPVPDDANQMAAGQARSSFKKLPVEA
jgi:hypothetical protein